MSPIARIVFLLSAGAVGGALGSAGAITSLVSYPALIVAGVQPLAANVTNIVAATALWPGSAIASLALVLLHPIDWTTTIPLAAGMLVGSALGPRATRRVSPTIVRPLVAAVGIALAVQLWLGHGA